MRPFVKMLFAAGVMLAGAALPARADFILFLSEGGETVTYDQTSGSSAVTPTTTGGASAGVATATGTGFTTGLITLKDYSITVTTTDNNAPGDPTSGFISVEHSRITNTTGATATLTITLSTNTSNGYGGFTEPSTAFVIVKGTLAVGSNTGPFSTNQKDFYNGAQEPPGPGSTLTTTGTVQQSALVASSTPYTLQEDLTVSITGKGKLINNFFAEVEVDATPAPPAFLLAGFGVPVLGCMVWLKRRGKKLRLPLGVA